MKGYRGFCWVISGLLVLGVVMLGCMAGRVQNALAGSVIRLEPRVSLKLQYDDNIYFSQADAVSDAVTYVAPGLHAGVEKDSWAGSIDYEMQWVSYYHNSSNDAVRHYLSLDGKGSFAENWSLVFNDSYARSEDPAQIEQAISGIRYESLEYDYNEGAIGLTRTFGAENYFTVGYENMFFKSRSPEVADTVSHHPYLDVTYWLSCPQALRLETGETIGRFDSSDDFQEPEVALSLIRRMDWDTTVSLRMALSAMDFEERTPDYTIYDLGLGIKRTFAGNTEIAAGLGYYYQDTEQGITSEKGVSGYLNLWRRSGRYRVSVEVSKGFDEIYFDGEDLGFSECWVAGGEINFSVRPDLNIGLESSYRDDTFPQAQAEVRERTWLLSFYADWQITSWCALSISFFHWDRDANYRDYTYLDNRFLLGVTFSRE